MYIKCSSSVHKKNEVAFKITTGHVIDQNDDFDQIVILKATTFFYGHLMYY